jgi:hypothetical protein
MAIVFNHSNMGRSPAGEKRGLLNGQNQLLNRKFCCAGVLGPGMSI